MPPIFSPPITLSASKHCLITSLLVSFPSSQSFDNSVSQQALADDLTLCFPSSQSSDNSVSQQALPGNLTLSVLPIFSPLITLSTSKHWLMTPLFVCFPIQVHGKVPLIVLIKPSLSATFHIHFCSPANPLYCRASGWATVHKLKNTREQCKQTW